MVKTYKLPPQVKTLPINGYEMAYLERGSGIPLILVHGGLSDYRHWLLQMRSFGMHYRTISISLRHCYPEQWNGCGDDFSVRQHLDDLILFIKELNAGKVHLLGHSLGGDIALLLASARPELLRSLILVEPAPMYHLLPNTPENLEGIKNNRTCFNSALDCLCRGDLDEGVQNFIDNMEGAGAWENISDRQKEVFRDNAWSIKSMFSAAQEPYACTDVANIELPILLVEGEISAPAYKIMLSALQACLPQHEKKTILKAPHAVNQASPKAFNAAILDFLGKY